MAREKRYRPTIYRTTIAGNIVAEIALPERQAGSVIILASGLPSGPNKKTVLEFLARQGYVAVSPRYRGTWESGGYFLERSPTQDIVDVLQYLRKQKKFLCAFTEKWIPVEVKSCMIIASSFGGPAGWALSEYPLVRKVILLSPALDWQMQSEGESIEETMRYSQLGYGQAIRLRRSRDWFTLLKPGFYDCSKALTRQAKDKILLIHCHDDTIVPIKPAIDAQRSGAIRHVYFKPHGGHLGLSFIVQLFFWHKIKVFFDQK